MRVFQGPSLASLHKQVVPHIRANCFKNPDGTPVRFKGENGQDTIECESVTLVCKTPLANDMFIKDTSILPFSQAFMDQYAHDLLYGSGKDFVYEYHNRLFEYGDYDGAQECCRETDQIAYIIDKLDHNPATRRGVAITWKPWEDPLKEDVPCLQLIHCTVRDARLHMEVVFRSEDMHLGLGPNMYGLVALQTYIAGELNVPVGTYTHVALCPHLYWWRDEDYLTNYR